MEEVLETFPDKEAFDRFFMEHFQPMSYDDMKEGLESLVKKEGLDIFERSYMDKINKQDFKEHLSKAARFAFDDAMTEAFYEKNPEVYEAAFAIYEAAPDRAQEIAYTFHKTYQEIYDEGMNCMFDAVLAPLLG